MNILKKVFLPLTLVTLILTQTLHAQNEQKVVDFTKKSFDYGYEGWKEMGDVLTKTDSGISITGEAKGGVGVYFPSIIDIIDSTTLEIKIKKGVGNTADKLRVKLMSADGTAVVDQSFNIKDLADDAFTVVKIALPKKGTGNYNKLEEIKQLQIQGEFTPGQKVDVELQNIIATNAPIDPAK